MALNSRISSLNMLHHRNCTAKPSLASGCDCKVCLGIPAQAARNRNCGINTLTPGSFLCRSHYGCMQGFPPGARRTFAVVSVKGSACRMWTPHCDSHSLNRWVHGLNLEILVVIC